MKKFSDTCKLYKMAMTIAIPIMIQKAITSFVNMLDNIMVGRTGTEEMAGVAIVTQIVFIYNLCIFGGFSGAGIFTTQFNGTCNQKGIRETCRFKFNLGIVLTLFAFAVMYLFGENLIKLFLNKGSDGNLEKTLEYGIQYMKIIAWSLPPFMVVQVYATTLSECGETVTPMKACLASFFVNLFLNWVLIFGNLGFSSYGVRGAAIATVIARIVEALIVVVWTHKHTDSFPFTKGLFSSLKIEKNLCKKIIVIGCPLLLNEALWSAGMSTLVQCYSMRGLDSVAGTNISTVLTNLFKIVFYSIGNTIGIMIGRELGAEEYDQALNDASKLRLLSVLLSAIVAALMFSVSSLFPKVYNTNETARLIATQIIIVSALAMPLDAFKNATYFILRSGGKTWLTFLFDGAFIWIVSVSIAFILSRFTTMSAPNICFCVYCGDIIKAIFGNIVFHKKTWIQKIAEE